MSYPREDKCRECGCHLGWILNELGEAVALGLCEECGDKFAGGDDDKTVDAVARGVDKAWTAWKDKKKKGER